jgi:hypothetical protein
MCHFESPFWDLTTTAAWAGIREPDVVRLAADPCNEAALFESRAAYLARWREVNERLWDESRWPKPNGPPLAIEIPRELPDEAAAEVSAEVTLIPSLSDERFTERLQQLEADGKIRLRRDDTFPVIDYLTSLFQAGRLNAIACPPGDTAAHTVPQADWAFLEIVGGDHRRLFIRRIGVAGKAFADVRVTRAQVLEVFPSLEGAPVLTRPRSVPDDDHGKKATVIGWLRHRFASGRPWGRNNSELQRLFERETGIPMHRNTFGGAVRETWPK